MEKKNFVSLIMGIVGGMAFALGMVMCLETGIGNFRAGVVLGIIGVIILVAMILIRRRMEGKAPIKLNGKTIGILLFAIIAIAVFGLGMVMVMVWNQMLSGIIVGCIGIVLCVCLIPLIKGIK